MLTINRSQVFLSGRRKRDKPLTVPYEGGAVSSYAQERDVICVVNGRRLEKDEFAQFTPHDGSILHFVECEADLVNAIILIVYIVAIVLSVSSGRSPSTRGAETATRDSGFGDESPSYGFNGIRNSTREGAAIPVVYGPHTVGGQVIQTWAEEGANESQSLFMLIGLSEGPVVRIGEHDEDINLPAGQGLGGLFINGLPVDGSLRGVQISLRMGSDTQSIIPGFETINVSFDQRIELTGASAATWATKDAVNEILVNLEFPSGLYSTNPETGDTETESVGVNMKVFPANEAGATTGPAVVDRSFTFTRSKRSAFYKTIKSGPLGIGFYKVEVRRTFSIPPLYSQNNNQSVDQCVLNSFVERRYVGQQHPNVALIGLRIQANEQISGSLPTVTTFLVGRNLLNQTPLDGGDNSDPLNGGDSFNPALAAWDMLTNVRYGMGSRISVEDLDVESFQEWADFCSELIPRFDGDEMINWVIRFQVSASFDIAGSGWEAVSRIARMSRAILVQLGSVIRVKLERADRVPVMLFTMGNIVPDTISIDYIPKRERANLVEVEFLDGRRPIYERMTETLEDPQLINEGQFERKIVLDCFGTTLAHQARRWGALIIRQERALDRRLTFHTGLDAVFLEPGDVVLVSHDMPDWAFSGRLTGVNGDGNVMLDRTVSIEADTIYTYLEADEDGDIQETTFSVGAGDAGDLTALPVTPLTSGGSVQGRLFVVGKKITTKREWLVERMERVNETEIQIQAIPYIPEIYSDSSEPFPAEFVEIPEVDLPDPVENLTAVETYVSDGVSRIALNWDAPSGGPTPNRYGIWVRYNDESPVGLNETTDTDYEHDFELPQGTRLTFIVVSYLSTGQGLTLDESESVAIDLMRDDATDAVAIRPDGMAGIVPLVVQQGATTLYDLTWTHPGSETLSTVRYDLRWGDWNGGGIVAELVNALTTTARAAAVARQIYLRARAIASKTYSLVPAVIELPATTHATYATEAGETTLDPLGAAISNGVASRWLDDRIVVYQIAEDIPLTFEAPVVDTGGVQATLIGWNIVCAPAFFSPPGHFYRLHPWNEDFAWNGDIDRDDYILWDWTLRYKSNLGDSWTELTGAKSTFSSDLVITGRYFQVVISAQRVDHSAPMAPVVTPPYKSRAMIARCHVKFLKA